MKNVPFISVLRKNERAPDKALGGRKTPRDQLAHIIQLGFKRTDSGGGYQNTDGPNPARLGSPARRAEAVANILGRKEKATSGRGGDRWGRAGGLELIRVVPSAPLLEWGLAS